MKRTWIRLLTAVFFLSACQSPVPTSTPIPLSPTLPTSTASVTPQPDTPTASVTAESTQTPAPITLQASVNASTLNMRTGPSILHDILNQYEQGDTVTVIGAAPGRQWLKVISKDGKTGWMYITHLNIDGDVHVLPMLPISESLTATGKVTDRSGAGIRGVQITLTRVGGATVVRAEATTIEDGTFYLYAPVEYQGTWLAAVSGADCDSPIVDNNCRFGGSFSPAGGISLTLPQNTALDFIYQ